ncbi:hypothetical protein [Cellulosimicrobium sp. NPDC057127]|uniref:hypothetical protein n=1 Tax=Cellulosimicrobium sp. NPDC057127 TaxID=3346026 RepID=UPI00362D4CF6
MSLAHSTDLSAADWIVRSNTPWHRLVTFGPLGFPEHARLRFIPDPAYPGQPEHDAARDAAGLSDGEQFRVAVSTLVEHTRSPDDGYILIWEGWGARDLPRGALEGPRVAVPERPCVLFRGSLLDLASGAAQRAWWSRTHQAMPVPAFVWPADRAWCVACDVDPHWAGIGAEPEAVDRLLAESRVDVVRADPDEQQPFYR